MQKAWLRTIWIGLALVFLLAPAPVGKTDPVERFFRLSASQFAYTPSMLRVNPGDQVTLELVAADVVHGLTIDGYGVQMTADPGKTANVRFVANKAGVYRFRCTVTCGNMHPFMIGKLQVGPNTLYWRAASLGLLALVAGFWKLHP